MGGVWPSAQEALASGAVTSAAERKPEVPGIRRVETARYTYTYVPKGAISYQWCGLNVLDSAADEGDHVGVYSKVRRTGKAPVWGGVDEVFSLTAGATTPAYGREISVMGPPGETTAGGPLFGVYGRTHDDGTGRPAIIEFGIKFAPFYPDWGGKAKLQRGIWFCEPTIDGALCMAGGDTIKFSEDPAVPRLGFDPATGWVGWWKPIDGRRTLVWGFHALTGETARMLPLE